MNGFLGQGGARRAFAILVAAAAAGAAFAVPVSSVTVRDGKGGDANLSDALSRCQVKAGMEYDPAACGRDVKALRDSGSFEEVTVEAEHGTDGIDIAYVVVRKPVYHGPLNVKGNDYWNAGKIAKFADLKDGYAYGDAEIQAAAGRVRQEYRKKDFADCKVKPVVEPISGSKDGIRVTMEIEEGPRVKTNSYDFEGNDSFEAADLRETFGVLPWWNPMGWFNDDPKTEQDYAEACSKVETFYRDKGYLDARVDMPTTVLRDDGKADKVFRVTEGTKYFIGDISVAGVSNIPPEAVMASITTIKTGDVAGDAALNDAAHNIEVFCGSGTNALAETHVAVRRIVSAEDPAKVNLTFVVSEGHPVEINRVLVRGNDYTKDKVIRREISLSPGDPMLSDKAEQSKRRLENLRYFERVQYYLEKTDAPPRLDGQPQLRDLVYEVEEKNTGQFMVGVGASSVDSVYGTVEVSESNFDIFSPWRFRGAGQKARALAQAGPRIQTYEASVTEPHLFDRLLELTVEAYRRQRWFDDYDVIRSGAAATLAYPVKFWPTAKTTGRLGFRLSAEYVEMDDVDNGLWFPADATAATPARPMFRDEESKYGDSWEVPLRVFWQDDTRDHFLFPKRGYRTQIYGDLVAADNEYWRLGGSYRKYVTVWKKYSHVLSFGGRVETLDTFSGELPIYDRLFLGGPRSIRGVDYREIAPRVWSQRGKKGEYAPWGGQTLWYLTSEYSVPIVKFVRVAAFTDLGSVGEDEFDFNTDYFCWSVGFGIRLDIEQFPVRLDFATPVEDPDDGVDKQIFSFSVGYDF